MFYNQNHPDFLNKSDQTYTYYYINKWLNVRFGLIIVDGMQDLMLNVFGKIPL